ncbi:MAG: hypothetical protein WB792_00075, partial [Desulfobacterales bacterium]
MVIRDSLLVIKPQKKTAGFEVPAVFDCFLFKQIQPDSNRPAHSFPPVIHHQRQKEEPIDDGLRPVGPTARWDDPSSLFKLRRGKPLRLEDGRKYLSTFLPSSIMLLSASDFLSIEHVPLHSDLWSFAFRPQT